MIKVRLDGKVVDLPTLKGADGKSAYQYAVEAGYEGTEQEFINLLIDGTDVINNHLTDTTAHTDIRNLISELQEEVNNISTSTSESQILIHDNDINAHTDIRESITGLEKEVGDLESLNTTAKTDIVSAINEVRNSIQAGGTDAAITMDTSTTTEGALKSYTIKQGDTTVGVIDIPKDMVVESGSVVKNPEGQEEGTYIKLVLANVSDPLYINVGTLIDLYKASESATNIQVTVDSTTREIGAVIVPGGVGTLQLADSAVTTVKIADANVTLAKLSTTVQASLAKADTAVQSVAEGVTNGTVSVGGTDVAVHGLGSAAYTESSAYDEAGAAAQALADAKAYADSAIEAAIAAAIAASY